MWPTMSAGKGSFKLQDWEEIVRVSAKLIDWQNAAVIDKAKKALHLCTCITQPFGGTRLYGAPEVVNAHESVFSEALHGRNDLVSLSLVAQDMWEGNNDFPPEVLRRWYSEAKCCSYSPTILKKPLVGTMLGLSLLLKMLDHLVEEVQQA
uniref:Uncharacterized protein n=1 Tax=Chromera velia CCMP2878 TaxID=1169474 RepID=A0A0G4I4F6_9ALVE|eukprot:Cvel_10880.t1-p1 / transcript=Cvel_10880.t1 / gene=Cvel_10880 / organism=Chromera_velia_CCMP2878 / gene_product=hypothetical protein / transcript_product=hypothetical protein / location=Cvel_scaffold667:12661-14004(+) / protein_length=149 / sequence_SO=supercontig / SO=protein_coding / is_pseudo=false